MLMKSPDANLTLSMGPPLETIDTLTTPVILDEGALAVIATGDAIRQNPDFRAIREAASRPPERSYTTIGLGMIARGAPVHLFGVPDHLA
jgi:hypothetical protein